MSSRKTQTTDIVIAGGGFVGLALGLALAGRADAPSGLSVTIVDAGPVKRSGHSGRFGAGDQRASAITAASRRMLIQLDAWQDLDRLAQPVHDMEITDSRPEHAVRIPLLQFDTLTGSADGLPAALIIENEHLLQRLRQAAGGHPAIRMRRNQVTGLERSAGGVMVSCDAGPPCSARLVVAADGVNSRVRAAAGIKTIRWDYGQWGLVATIKLELDHGGKAIQHFLPAGPFAMLPLPGQRGSLVWNERERTARRLLKADKAQLEDEIQKRLGHRFGAVSLTERPQGFPLGLSFARSFIGDRVALVGDAAHRLHPLAGQGINLGFKDAAALAEIVLDAARLGEPIGSAVVLERYQRWRRFDAAGLAMATDGLNRMFSNDNDAIRIVRDIGLGLVDRMPRIKRALVREAAGDTGTLPRLLQGEPA